MVLRVASCPKDKWFFLVLLTNDKRKTQNQQVDRGLLGSMVAVVFQSVFYSEMHQNVFFF